MDPQRQFALLVHHPVVQETDLGRAEVAHMLDILVECDLQVLAMRPNSDAGHTEIAAILDHYSGEGRIGVATHLPRSHFVSLMSRAAMMIGNSSSGIIEAASFGTPVVNIGSRQNLRERNANVLEAEGDASSIRRAIERALAIGRFPIANIYGDGQAAKRIVDLLNSIDLSASVLKKTNAY